MNKFYHVIELNKLGDHITIKEFKLKKDAEIFAKVMESWAEEGEIYYVADIRDEW